MMTAMAIAQENALLNRDFWKTIPTLTQVQDLVKKGNDPVQLNENAFDATIYALLEKADHDVVKYLLSFKGNSVDKNTHDSRIYLHWAAYAGHAEMVKYLLASGSDVTKTHETELNYFLNKGFALDSKDNINNGIFNYAAKKGDINFLKLLVDKGVDSITSYCAS